MQMSIASEILPFNVIRTLPSTPDLLEIWINLNINVTNLNSFWNVIRGNKNALLLCHMSAWYIVEMSSKAWKMTQWLSSDLL